MKAPPTFGPIVGESMAIRRVRELIGRCAPTVVSVLLVGATGTGKELVAHHIHVRSGRRGRFVGVNCACMPTEMADGLLFGYERGAFSGAVRQHRGYLECADQGTLFLDELASLPLDGQAKLLRALDTGEIKRMGDEVERYVDLRVIGAVQEDLDDRLASGALRSDLFRRVGGIVIELPPLADRPEDVIPLAQYFAAERGQTLESKTAAVLTRHSWPGNVRELRQVIDRAGCLVENGTLPPRAVREAIALGTTTPKPAGELSNAPIFMTFTHDRLVALFSARGWNAERIARHLGMGRTQFFRELRAAGLTLRGLRKVETYASVRERSRTDANAPNTGHRT